MQKRQNLESLASQNESIIAHKNGKQTDKIQDEPIIVSLKNMGQFPSQKQQRIQNRNSHKSKLVSSMLSNEKSLLAEENKLVRFRKQGESNIYSLPVSSKTSPHSALRKTLVSKLNA